ncbi:MAG TPA: hypothetical protein VLE27_17685, partial [Thermoanaerobaculia bacterium]|nr:hypothetical protein [Thermoanaerobaculia bacterium]
MPFFTCRGWRSLVTPLALALAMICGSAAFAQTGSTDDRVRELERQVEQLRAEIAAMKSGGEAGDADRMAELERRLEILAGEIEKMNIGEAATADQSTYGLGPAASKIYRAERGVSIGGYGELRYQDFDSDRSSDFDLLRAILYFGYKWNDRWVFNSEVEYEHAGEEVALEFAYLDYLWRPEANLRAGLVL